MMGSLWRSFSKTIIESDRWMLLLDGLSVTLTISICSAILGIALGYVAVYSRYYGSSWARKLIGAYETVMRAQPIVVVLLVMYYVVFASMSISGEVIAIISFSISMGAMSGGAMWASVKKVDRRQVETGLALGYTQRQVFRRIIMPIAAHDFMPSIASQCVGLVRDTSVVGYIAVHDLTRATDLIRSRTMEALFPLVITAIIYFALCRLVAWLLGKLILRIDVYHRRSRMTEGMNP